MLPMKKDKQGWKKIRVVDSFRYLGVRIDKEVEK